ncbi:MAG: DUF1127 domain-containing protein [Pseudomonadota bacterium]
MTITTILQRGPRVLDLAGLAAALGAQVALWRERAAFRRELRRLTKVGDHILRDIGLTREQAIQEAAKPFWQA